MRIEHLMYLVEIAKTKSISQAAKHFYISHQGMSNAIAMTEKELGVTLLYRTNKGVELTEIGQQYVDMAGSFLESLQELKNKTNPSANENLTGTVSIYAAPLFGVCILPKTIAEYQKKYPDVKINIKQTDSQEVLNTIAEGNADIGLISVVNKDLNKIKRQFKFKQLKIEKLFLDNIYVLAAKSSPLSLNDSITMRETLKYPLAIYYSMKDIISYLDKYAYLYGTPNITVDSECVEISSATIAEGLSVGFISEYNLKKSQIKLANNVSALPLSDDIHLFVGLAVNGSEPMSKCSSLFLDTFNDMKPSFFN